MDSKRRMVEIHIWNQAFFSQLTNVEKLFYLFTITNCDNVGVYQHNPKLANFHCDSEIDFLNFIEKVNFELIRLELIDDNTIWIKDFVRDTWTTLAAKNNLGLSCYKLLVKHGLLERFIAEYPNNINIQSFREAIMENHKGYGDLPLPQNNPSPAPESDQDKYRLGTINNNISDSINGSINISNTTPDNHGESALDFEKRSKAFPKHLTGDGVYERMGLGKETGELPFK